jgi:hypothetical protein
MMSNGSSRDHAQGVSMKTDPARRRQWARSVLPLLAACLAQATSAAVAQAPGSSATAPPSTEQQTTSGPRVETETTLIDLGQLARGETSEARFALHNRGDETLQILRVKPG